MSKMSEAEMTPEPRFKSRAEKREDIPISEHRDLVRGGTEIFKIRVAGRGTHICPRCQKVKK